MRYYEIVFMIHPDCNGQISGIIDHYTGIVIHAAGRINRIENWGCRQLAYPIKKVNKAYYILLNIEVYKDTIGILNNDFRFNDVIIRSMIVREKRAITEPSPMMKKTEEHQERLIL